MPNLARSFPSLLRGMAGAGTAITAAAKLAATAARIFGTVLGTAERSGRKVLARPLIGDKVAEYYGKSVSAADPLYEDPLDKRCVCGGERRRAGGQHGTCKARGRDVFRMCVFVGVRRRKVKLERLKRRGKSPPKKGQGKRAGKR
jgi:small subunit ribosomal protein S33